MSKMGRIAHEIAERDNVVQLSMLGVQGPLPDHKYIVKCFFSQDDDALLTFSTYSRAHTVFSMLCALPPDYTFRIILQGFNGKRWQMLEDVEIEQPTH